MFENKMKKIFLLASVLSTYSCSVRQTECDLVKVFQDKGISFPQEAKTCVIIPEGGCGGCIARWHVVYPRKQIFFLLHTEVDVASPKTNTFELLKRKL